MSCYLFIAIVQLYLCFLADKRLIFSQSGFYILESIHVPPQKILINLPHSNQSLLINNFIELSSAVVRVSSLVANSCLCLCEVDLFLYFPTLRLIVLAIFAVIQHTIVSSWYSYRNFNSTNVVFLIIFSFFFLSFGFLLIFP